MAMEAEREALEKRRQAAEDARANRQRDKEDTQPSAEDNAALDNLLEKLRNGDSVGRKARRTRKGGATRAAAVPLTVDTDTFLAAKSSGDTVDIARDMLMRLKSDGFDAQTPLTPTLSSTNARRSRRKKNSEGIAALAALGEGILPGGIPQEDSEDGGIPQLSDSSSTHSQLSDSSSTAVSQVPGLDSIHEQGS